MEYRIEKDSLGEVKVEKDAYWGSQTQRSLIFFNIGIEIFSPEIIKAFAVVKKSAAIANLKLGIIDKKISETIQLVCDEIYEGKFSSQFPLSIWQTGSGTQTNMNLNEVISNRANELLGREKGAKTPVHPNDHVNLSQSSNDIFPTVMHTATAEITAGKLIPELDSFYDTIISKSKEFAKIIKCGRTHLQDAVPLTLGQEFSGYADQIKKAEKRIEKALEEVYELALGGTAVGTGLNSHKDFPGLAIKEISRITALPFREAENKFSALSSHEPLLNLSGALNTLASALMKIANDIRWLSSGPRCGIGEIKIPENEPGSSIMPGKVNPTQCEALTMVCLQVMGNHTTISIASSSGNFELNVYKPVIIHNLMQSILLLSDSIKSFCAYCFKGIVPDLDKINYYMENNLMLVTALNSKIGYEKSAQIARKAYLEEKTLRQAALELGYISEQDFDLTVNPENMIGPDE